MRVVVQRVSEASVSNNNIHNAIQKGYCLLVGIGKTSTEADVQAVAKKSRMQDYLKTKMTN